jgi:hypothetical protein
MAMESQLADTVVMVTPDQFRWEGETAETNKYMKRPEELGIAAAEVPILALREFRAMVHALESHGVSVLVLRSPWETDAPDAVFPNNWFSHHREGQLVLYPMQAPVRRNERQPVALLRTLAEAGIAAPEVIDLTTYERDGLALEGTGSLILDWPHRVAFALESARTSKPVFDDWCRRMGYEPVFFHAVDEQEYPIYHTNVVLTIGESFAVLCLDAIPDTSERELVQRKLAELGKNVITIDRQQLRSYCANLLQLRTRQERRVLVLSQSALDAFSPDQRQRLERHGELVAVSIPTIEGIGGGSARCMLAEVFR